ncbi:MAG: DUF456 domain-containing protein [Bacteroidales bacterium]
MDLLLIVLAVLLALVGIVGAIIPGLPGPPLGFLALVLLHLTKVFSYSGNFLLITGIIALVITLLDYFVPIWGTKKFGGTKAGVRGSIVGLIIGIFVLPIFGIVLGPFGLFGILLGPFLGALIGERMAGTNDRDALRSAFGSFIGFLAGTLMKLGYGLVILFYVIKDIITNAIS